MSTTITNVVNTSTIISAEFVKLTITTATTEVITFSTSYKNETIGGVSYVAMGGLVGVGTQQRDLRVSGHDTTISLVGVDPVNINMVLAKALRGAEVEIYRGFYDSSYVLTNTVKRFTGIVTSYNIQEQREGQDDMFMISVNCSNYKAVLENNVNGRRTNRDTWNYFYNGTDTSMDNVEKLSGAFFDFGVPVK
jgi:hypothetical protein